MTESEETENRKVLIAMSGGVDSSVAAALLKMQGYDVIGVHLKLWDHGDQSLKNMGGRCCSLVDANDARRVCDQIGIPFYVINAQEAFREAVVDYFVHEYLQMRTPNPCVQCNTKIKFNYLFNKADELGCQYVATGHYSQIAIDTISGIGHLKKASDPQKDQSYFLFGVTQAALKRILMPVGGLSKAMVRRLAVQFELQIADKPDSQEICFIGDEGYADFVQSQATREFIGTGIIRNSEGSVIGDHRGFYRYTIGQRKGLENLKSENPEEPYYIIGFDKEKNALVVGHEKDLFKHELIARNVNWIQQIEGVKALRCNAKIRSRHEEAPCVVTLFENAQVRVRFDDPQRAITPGQVIVFYRGEEVLGGGFIHRVG